MRLPQRCLDFSDSTNPGIWVQRTFLEPRTRSTESPPESRGLVFVDGIHGEVVACHVEANPEDWETGPGEAAEG